MIVAHVVKELPETLAKAIALGDQHRESARQLVERLVADHAPGAVAVVLEGPVARRLAELARERKADEIVIGSRGLGRFSAALGSVSHAPLQQADHPVVVGPAAAANHPREEHAHGDCTVVVGYDGSEPARAALSYTARRSGDGGRVVAVLGSVSHAILHETDRVVVVIPADAV